MLMLMLYPVPGTRYQGSHNTVVISNSRLQKIVDTCVVVQQYHGIINSSSLLLRVVRLYIVRCTIVRL